MHECIEPKTINPIYTLTNKLVIKIDTILKITIPTEDINRGHKICHHFKRSIDDAYGDKFYQCGYLSKI